MKKKLTSVILILVMLFALPCSAHALSKNNKKELMRYIYFSALSNAKTEVDAVDLFLKAIMKMVGDSDEKYEEALKAFTQSIDEYGDYLSPEESLELDAELNGASGGIGSTVEMRNGKIYVVNVLPGSPSEKMGVQVGHTITKADGISLEGMSLNEALNYIRGEVGTEVVITFEDPMGNPYDMILIRDLIEIASLSYSTFTDYPNIGYIEITNFSVTTGEELREAITDLKNQNVNKLILDLRYNGGGVLSGAVEVAGVFLDEGKEILTVEPKDETLKETYYASGKLFDGEMIVLVNEYSASASEVVTGALKDHGRASVFGEITYGKGTVQNLFSLPLYGGYFKYTTAEYLTPNGTSINNVGIKPDYTVYNESYRLEEEDLPPFTYERVMRYEDTGEDVKNLKSALKLLNYQLDDTDVFDVDTYNAVKSFQQTTQLFPYGVCDFTTQQYLKTTLLETRFYEDTQLNTALEDLAQ
ncbi:MAG: S41 family peptidase [Clostridia bacterium]|nr:S41 family peptidase [Clostridia bacterium]